MTHKLPILFLLFGSFCAAQTDYNTAADQTAACLAGPVSPEEAAQCSPYTSQTPATGMNENSVRNGTDLSPGSTQRSTEASPSPGTRPVSSTRVIGPITARSEFEMFAEDAAGRTLPVYGRQLFDEGPTTFAPMDHVPVPTDYVVGPGDQLLIRVWGKIDLDSSVTVDRNGQIFLAKVGTVRVAGLRYEQLDSYLRAAIGTLYKGFELNVTMGQLRSMQIFILGSARQPGAYTVSSLSTLVNALFASGGPSATGSMRHIQLRRDNRVLADFDIYDLLRRGDKSQDVQLLPGDVIYVPPVGPQVALMGSVNEPGIYELRGETTIASVLADAGGLTNLAEADRVLLEQIENHRRRRADDFPLDVAGLQRELKDGDLLRIFPISPEFENTVTLRGNVANPGRFPWHDGMRVSDLIPSRDALVTRRYWYQESHLAESAPAGSSWSEENGVRRNPRNTGAANQPYNGAGNPRGVGAANQGNGAAGDPRCAEAPNPARDADSDQRGADTPNQEYDAPCNPRGTGNANQEYAADGNPGDAGAARHEYYAASDLPPGSELSQQSSWPGHKPTDAMQDLLENSAEINWDYASIQRLDAQDLSTRLISFNLGNAINSPASADNQLLKPGDVVTIFSRSDIPLPENKQAKFIRVSGEVNAPGVYRVEPGETLRNVVERAGGLTPHSYLFAAQLTRLSTRRAQQEQVRVTMAQMQKDLDARYAASSWVSSADMTEQQTLLKTQQAAIAQLAAIRPTGRIVLDMKPGAGTVADIPDFALEDGDSFYIPPRLGTVQVAGAVYNENAFRCQSGRQLSAYLNEAGGPTRQADASRIFLVRADGSVISRQTHGQFWRSDFENTVLLPGDAIIVPTRAKVPSTFMQQLPVYAQILSQAALTGAVIGSNY